jgi:hypothetical protein
MRERKPPVRVTQCKNPRGAGRGWFRVSAPRCKSIYVFKAPSQAKLGPRRGQISWVGATRPFIVNNWPYESVRIVARYATFERALSRAKKEVTRRWTQVVLGWELGKTHVY